MDLASWANLQKSLYQPSRRKHYVHFMGNFIPKIYFLMNIKADIYSKSRVDPRKYILEECGGNSPRASQVSWM